MKVVICVAQRDGNFIDQMVKQLDTFYKSVLLPELITRHQENNATKPKIIHAVDETLQRYK